MKATSTGGGPPCDIQSPLIIILRIGGLFPGMFKVVILDEVDGVSDQFFKALRATMEQFASNSRFIATCNYINKLPDPILSRFEVINFDFDKEDAKAIKDKLIAKMYALGGVGLSANQVGIDRAVFVVGDGQIDGMQKAFFNPEIREMIRMHGYGIILI